MPLRGHGVSLRGPRLTVALLLGVIVVLILGAGTALTVSRSGRLSTAGRNPSAAPSNTNLPTTHASSSGSAVPEVAGASGAGAAGGGGTGSPPATSGARPVIGPSNNVTVQLTPAARADPRALVVEQLLQSYFDAINRHDYAAWEQVVAAPLAQREDTQRWLDAYATTVDSSIWMLSLTGNPLRVQLRFTSEQDPELAPADFPVGCIDWTLTYQLERRKDQLVVGSTVPGSVSKTKCA